MVIRQKIYKRIIGFFVISQILALLLGPFGVEGKEVTFLKIYTHGILLVLFLVGFGFLCWGIGIFFKWCFE